MCSFALVADLFTSHVFLLMFSTGKFTCEICGKSFKAENYLKVHMVIHSSELPFECERCEAKFNRKDKLTRHMLIHDPVKRFKCPFRSLTGK